MPSARAYLREGPGRSVALAVVVHPPARDRATLAHSAGMRRPRADLSEDPLGRISAPETAAAPAGNLARNAQPARMQIPRAHRAELPLRRIRLSIIEHIPPKAAGAPTFELAVAFADCAGEVPACGDVDERA